MPVVARNIYIGAPPLNLCSANAFTSTFINSNAGDSVPGHGFCISRHFARIMGETGGRQVAVVLATLRTHSSFTGFFKMMWDKWSALWHWYEQPNNTNFYYYRLHIPLLACLPVTFFLVSPLALIGLMLAAGELRRRWPLYLVGANLLGIRMMGLVLARYRVPFQAVLLPFAAWSVVSMINSLMAKRTGWAIGIVVALAAMALWTMRPLPASRPLIRCADYAAAYSAYYSPMAMSAIQGGDWNAAAGILRSSLLYEPSVVREFGRGRAVKDSHEAALADLFAQVHQRLGEALRRSGKLAEADIEDLRSRELRSVAEKQ